MFNDVNKNIHQSPKAYLNNFFFARSLEMNYLPLLPHPCTRAAKQKPIDKGSAYISDIKKHTRFPRRPHILSLSRYQPLILLLESYFIQYRAQYYNTIPFANDHI